MATEASAYFLDCDGTLYVAEKLLPRVGEVLARLREEGKKLFFLTLPPYLQGGSEKKLTNTSSRSQQQLHDKLVRLGVDARLEECYPSGTFAARYIQRRHPESKRVYVVGGDGLLDELRKKGFQCDGGQEEQLDVQEHEFATLCDSVVEKQYEGVVVGFDLKFSFRKLLIVSTILASNPTCFFYATNDDPFDMVHGHAVPATGALLAALQFMASAAAPARNEQKQPFSNKAVVLGKPNPEYAREVARLHDVELSQSVFVGDRLDTDILCGNQAGMQTLLVETGVHSRHDISRLGIHPTWTISAFGDLAAREEANVSRI